MWGQQRNDTGENQGTPQKSGNLWSRLVQVATDVAQDLAQPEVEYEEEGEEYYEEDGQEYYEEEGEGGEHYEVEGEGWDGTPSWEGQEPPLLQQKHEGEVQDQYLQGGEDQYDEGEYEHNAYEGEEEYQFEQEGQCQDEEQVDFNLEPQYVEESAEHQQPQQPEQSLFGGATEQSYFQESGAGSADDWDLEDEALFDDDVIQPEPVQRQEQEIHQEPEGEQQLFSEDGNPDLGGNFEGESGGNDWVDDSLNFDDSQFEEEVLSPAETEGVIQKAPQELYDEPQQQQQETICQLQDTQISNVEDDNAVLNAWDDGLKFDDSQEVTTAPAAEMESAVEQALPETCNDSSQQQGETIEDVHQEEQLVAGDNAEEDNIAGDSPQNEWDDSFNFDDTPDNKIVPVETTTEGASGQSDQESHDESRPQQEVTIFQDLERKEQVKTGQDPADLGANTGGRGENNPGDSDNLSFDASHIEGEIPVATDNNIGGQLPQDTNNAAAEEHEKDAWNDDLAFDDLDQAQAQEQNDNNGGAGSELLGQESPETCETADQEPHIENETAAILDDDSATEQLPKEGDALDIGHLNLSDHHEVGVEMQATAGDSKENDGNEDDAWDNDELNFIGDIHLEPPLALGDAGLTPNAEAWNDDDLNFSEHHDEGEHLDEGEHHDEGAAQLQSQVPSEDTGHSAAAAAAAQPEASGASQDTIGCVAGNDEEINICGHPEAGTAVVESEPPGSAQAETDQDGAWDNDDLDLSSHHEAGASASENVQPVTDKDSDLNVICHHEASASDVPAEPSDGANGDVCGVWDGDDLNFSSHHEANVSSAAQALPSDSAGFGGGDDMENKDVNFSSHHEANASGVVRADFLDGTEAVASGGDGWDDDDVDVDALTGHGETNERVQEGSGFNLGDGLPGTSTEESRAGQKPWDTGNPEGNLTNETAAPNVSQETTMQSAWPDTVADADAWNDSDLQLAEDGDDDGDGEEVDDDSTVEQSNIGCEPPIDDGKGERQISGDDVSKNELKFVTPGRTSSRRATVRASNTSTSCLSRKDSEDESAALSEKILGTSVMFADLTVSDRNCDQKPSVVEEDSSGRVEDAISTIDVAGAQDASTEDNIVGTENREIADGYAIRDNLSSVSGNSEEPPKRMFETQISLMTLKSIADSCPSTSRHRDDTSDDEDERGFGPVVDKTPELSADTRPIPELSTMTINSTAVVAHSVNDDIQRDDDMDGTYYGGSTTGEGQSNENVWEEDDASSLGGLHDLSEKIVNFELSTNPIDTSTPQEDTMAQQADAAQQEANISTPQLDSSMAIVYADDNSLPSRDKDEDNEDNYKPVVDQIPKPLQRLRTRQKSGRTLNSMAVLAGNTREDGKEDGSTTNRDSAEDADENAWDDGASLEDLEFHDPETGDMGQNREVVASAARETSQVVVDNTPNEAGSTSGKSGGSLAAVESVENSCPSRVHDSDEEQYGLVVDQIPASPPPVLDQMSVAASCMAVVANNVEGDLQQDEELDASCHGGSTIDELAESGWENDDGVLEDLDVDDGGKEEQKTAPLGDSTLGTAGGAILEGDAATSEGDRVVDLTPRMEPKKLSRLSSNSLAVLAHSINQDFEDDDDEDEENDANFGPVVDITPAPQRPPAMTPSSTAAQATNIREDIKQDEATADVGDVTWEDECPELEDIQLLEGEEDETESEAHVASPPAPDGQATRDQVVLVDHTPAEGDRLRKGKGDASLAVLAPSEDGTCLSMDDDDDDELEIDQLGERVSYGPVVDITPTLPMLRTGVTSTAPSVTFSLAVEARSVDEDFKLDDEMDETFCGDTTIEGGGGENAWGDDQTLEELDNDQSRSRLAGARSYECQPRDKNDNSQPNFMVDHTPQINTSQPRMGDESLVALAPSVASTYRTGDDSANDDDSITHDEDVYGKVVDHTPRLAHLPLVKSNSMAVGASSADFRSEMERDEELDDTCFGESADDLDENGWGADENDLEEIVIAKPHANETANEIMVDHTPKAEEQQKSTNIDPSVAVLAPSDDGSREEDDNDTFDLNHVYGRVVDMTPLPPSSTTAISSSVATRPDGELEGTLFGDSTVGGEPGWDEDDAIIEDLLSGDKDTADGGADPSNANLWQSAELTSDNVSSQLEGSTIGKSSQGGVVMVDHTPSEIDSSAQKNSVAWLLNVESGISGDETDDAACGWGGDDHMGAPDTRAEEDQVVDRIPQGPESRFGDASTVVVADPSEVLSHVGDMLQEEGDFGPVVDQTPPSGPSAQNAFSAAGSTVVVAPTVAPDDLDDADPDDTLNAAEENGWENDPPELEQAPNPQSGNEEETAQVREQVVDFLPPQEETVTDQNRDGWSTVATGGAPSVLQADPKEDEFGPVVDQLPAPHQSTPFSAAISTASQVAPSECAALAGEDETEYDSKLGRGSTMVVEMGMQNLDSTASLAQSLASEDEDDKIENYGPVVDHLPSIRSSLPPSRGGSTVDALATVSEVIDDDDDEEAGGDDSTSGGDDGNDGWGDDDLGNIDVSERIEGETPPAPDMAAPAPSKDPSDDHNNSQTERGMTVRFRSVVAAIFESNGNAVMHSNATATEEHGSAEDNQIFHDDVDAGEPSVWDDDLDFDVSLNMDSSRASGGNAPSIMSSPERLAQFAEADTPPATPYSRSKPAHHETNGMPPAPVALPDLAISSSIGALHCNTCANATTIDCPCVQRILRRKEEGDDDAIKIDYTKLLQTEISKRRLIEEESSDLRSQLDALKNSKTAGEVRMETVRTLQEHVKVVEDRLTELGADCETLRNQNHGLQTSLNEERMLLSEWEERQKQWTGMEAALIEEIERTRQQLENSLTEAGNNYDLKEQELLAEATKTRDSVDRLSNQLTALQAECSKLRSNNSSMESDLQSLRETLAQRDKDIQELLAKEAAYEAEVNSLKESMNDLEMANASSEGFRQQCEEVEAMLASKEAALGDFAKDLTAMQGRVQEAEGERHKQMKDQARLTKQHEENIARNNNELIAARAELAEVQNLLDQERNDSNWKLQEVESEIERLSAEKELLEKRVHDIQSAGQNAMSDLQSRLDQKNCDLQAVNKQLSSVEVQNAGLEAEVERLSSVMKEAEHLEEQLQSMYIERDSLLNSLNEESEKVTRLQHCIDDHGLEEGAMEAMKNQEIESLVAERTSLRNTIAASNRQVEALELKSTRLADEKQAIQNEIAQLKASCDSLRASAESSRLAAANNAANQSKLAGELESLQQQLELLRLERDEAQRGRDQASLTIEELEFCLGSAGCEAELNAEKVSELEGLLSKAQEEIFSLRESNTAISSDRDHYRATCEDMEHKLTSASHTSDDVSRLVEENTCLSNKIRAVQQEFNDQSIVLQNFEARMAALENELSSERESGVKKEEAMTELKRELELTRADLEESVEGANTLPKRIAELEAMVSRFETDRKELEEHLALLASKEQEFHEISESLSQERDVVLGERNRLAEENEEMLIQFGWLNDQIESYKEQIQKLQELVQRYERTSEVADARLLELQQLLVAAEHSNLESDEPRVSHPSVEEAELQGLRNEQNKLIQEIKELSNANAEKDAQIKAFNCELESVKEQLASLEDVKAQSASVAMENDELLSRIDDMESLRNELDATCTDQASEISRLFSKVESVQSASSAFESRVSMLEEACAARDQALEQKEVEMRELAGRFHEVSKNTSVSTSEMLALRDRIHQMEKSARESTSEIHEISAKYNRSQEELEVAKMKLTTLEASVEELEQELTSKEEELRQEAEDYEGKLSVLENKLHDKRKEVAELTKQKAALSSEMDVVRSDLQAELSHVSAVEQALTAEVESLMQQIASLQDQLETSNSRSNELEQSHQVECSDLKRSLAKKDGEVVMLKHKIQSLSNDLDESRKETRSMQQDLEKMTSEMDELQRQQGNVYRAGGMSAAQLLQQTKENADDVDNLRSTVITLASALETSESRRADAIDRLVKERETYASTIRRLSDSVKRFYNTLNCSEP